LQADNLNNAIKAAGGKVPAYYTAIFEKVNAKLSLLSVSMRAWPVVWGSTEM